MMPGFWLYFKVYVGVVPLAVVAFYITYFMSINNAEEVDLWLEFKLLKIPAPRLDI
jgi:hypothetical protein